MTRAKGLRPSRVLNYARAHASVMQGNLRSPLPPWYGAMTLSPPGQTLVREMPVQHQVSTPGTVAKESVLASLKKPKRFRKPSRQFKPQAMVYEEDRLRTEFFGDHPWELARPRTILEDGMDGQKENEGRGWDWSKAYQPGRPVNGESVIQRQQWLMTHPCRDAEDERGRTFLDPRTRQPQRVPMDRSEAYDTARTEHYQARHRDAVESRIAAEEAQATGASFGPSTLDIGMMLENRTYEVWKGWAKEQVTLLEQTRSAAYTGGGVASQDQGEQQGSINSLGDAVDQIGVGQAPRP